MVRGRHGYACDEAEACLKSLCLLIQKQALYNIILWPNNVRITVGHLSFCYLEWRWEAEIFINEREWEEKNLWNFVWASAWKNAAGSHVNSSFARIISLEAQVCGMAKINDRGKAERERGRGRILAFWALLLKYILPLSGGRLLWLYPASKANHIKCSLRNIANLERWKWRGEISWRPSISLYHEMKAVFLLKAMTAVSQMHNQAVIGVKCSSLLKASAILTNNLFAVAINSEAICLRCRRWGVWKWRNYRYHAPLIIRLKAPEACFNIIHANIRKSEGKICRVMASRNMGLKWMKGWGVFSR